MTQLECIKGLKYLGLVFGKEFTQEECEIYYDHLKNYNYDTFRSATRNIAQNTKYRPQNLIAALIEACENAKHNTQFELLEYMNKKGYFKEYTEKEKLANPTRPSEYDRAINFVGRGIIPEWLRNDMKKYYAMMIKEKSSNLLQDSTNINLLENSKYSE